MKNMHLVIRCTYAFIVNNIELKETIQEHLNMIEKKNATWWGVKMRVNEKNIGVLKNQIKNKINTYAYIYLVSSSEYFYENQ